MTKEEINAIGVTSVAATVTLPDGFVHHYIYQVQEKPSQTIKKMIKDESAMSLIISTKVISYLGAGDYYVSPHYGSGAVVSAGSCTLTAQDQNRSEHEDWENKH